MKIVVIRGLHGKTSSIWLPLWAKLTISCCLLGLPLGAGLWVGAELLGEKEGDFFDAMALQLETDIESQQKELVSAKARAESRLQGLSLKLAQMQVKLARLEALGEVLTVQAELDDGEFDFSAVPAVGGPELASPVSTVSEQEILENLDSLSYKLEDRIMQLNLVADLIQDKHLKEETRPSGLPAEKGWMSSAFGRRIDPFTGESAWHNGVDIAGRFGSNVKTVAAGVVTYSGERYGYGQMVEVTHDNGYITRYGHNSELLVTLGEIVKKGQLISKMGTSGRSTGPHVHFEVFKNGRAVDPASYIRGTIR